MALGSNQDISSYVNNQQPQQNQYLTGNPSTDNSAQTSWMNPDSNNSISYSGRTPQTQASQPTTTPQNGTFLGSISAGMQSPQTGAPLGFDAQKWADPSQGNSNKYQVGRILAAGGSIQDAAKAVGAKVIAPDKIQYPDGFVADVYYDYGGPQQRVQYTDITPGGQQQGPQQGQPNSFMQWIQQLFGQNGGNINQPSMGWAQPINRGPMIRPNMPNPSGPIGSNIDQPIGFGENQNTGGLFRQYGLPFNSFLTGQISPYLQDPNYDPSKAIIM